MHRLRRWLGHGTMAILTVHGCGFYFIWLWQHEWLRGLVWDRNGTNMLAGEGWSLPLLPGAFAAQLGGMPDGEGSPPPAARAVALQLSWDACLPVRVLPPPAACAAALQLQLRS
jgi:hypothetical protein